MADRKFDRRKSKGSRSGKNLKAKPGKKQHKKSKLRVKPGREPERDLLNVGGDDSNHSGDARGDIIVATFSSYHEDGVVYDFANVRDYVAVEEWLKFPGRTYLFTLVTGEKYRASQQNVVSQMPKLIRAHLERQERVPSKIRVSLDGRLSGESRDALRNNLRDLEGVRNVVANNFIKKGYPKCPPVVYAADVIANHLYGLTFAELSTHESFIA